MRTEQYRETLRKEIAKSGISAAALEEELQKLINERNNSSTILSNTNKIEAPLLYDIGRKHVTPFDPRSTKDTFYRFKPEIDKNLGNTQPLSYEIGEGAWNYSYKPPIYGGKSEVKNFFDKSHLTVG